MDFKYMSGHVPALGPADTTGPVGGEVHMLEAGDVVADRAGRYGHPVENFQTIADFWITYIRRRYGVDLPIEPQDVGQILLLVKVAREANTHEPDNLVDESGYARCTQMIHGEVRE